MTTTLLLALFARVALVDCEVHPVTTAPLERATVLVEGERIVGVGRSLPIPEGFEVIRCGGRPLTPGLIDADTQIGLVEIGLEPFSNDAMPTSLEPVRADLDPKDAIDLRSTLVAVARSHGITSAVTAPVGGVVEGRAAWLDLVDPISIHASDAVTSPAALAVNLGQAAGPVAAQSRLVAHSILRAYLDDAAAYRRNRAAFARRALYPMSVSRLDLEAAQPVLKREIPLVVEVHRAADIRSVLGVAESHDVDLVLLGVSEGWLVADELARRGVPVIVEATQNLPFQLEARNARSDNVVRMAQAGVPVILSTRSAHNAGNLRFHLGNAVRAGLPPDVALRAGTRAPAVAFGRDDLGSIERGRTANLVVWSGDPFEPATSADLVLIRGERQPTSNRQRDLAERYLRRLGLASETP